MKLLLDQNISFRILPILSNLYPDSTQVKLVGLEKATDLEIWHFARQGGFTVVTKDADFYELSILNGIPPKIIWLQCGNVTNDYIAHLLSEQYHFVEAFLNDSEISCLEIK